MSQAEKKPKRIVTKTAYFGHVSKREGLKMFGMVLIVPGLIMLVSSISTLLTGWVSMYPQKPSLLMFLRIILVRPAIGFLLLICGTCAFKRADKMETVVPLTRQNTGHLPADESLVRAASKPIQPADELLRAAHGGQETPPEQLLRPLSEKEQRP